MEDWWEIDFLAYFTQTSATISEECLEDTAHSIEPVRTFLAARPGRVHLYSLPVYSPELNLVELVRSYLKRSLKNQGFTSLTELRQAIKEKIKLLEDEPKLVSSFFK